ncbi:helix-turn-helix transcriptional regulator [Bauldia litoralis]|uniref:Regulatory protein, luxR family n=1 Tax=Bauldia litoralis TaxID=665467 RepID=A0A1G6EA96_9HYPH|nr:helix-turn-helix transcriptional regulator [Bauldia litoralis]SDB54364.1 regulatory protein, luxR family [Bauldia litoralis]
MPDTARRSERAPDTDGNSPQPTPALAAEGDGAATEETLALAALMLMSPRQVLALQEILGAPDGVPRDDPASAPLVQDIRALGPLLDVGPTHIRISNPALRPAFQSALARYRQVNDPVARIRTDLSEGRMGDALAVLAENGGAFLSMIHGLERAREVASLFPEDDAERPPDVMVLDVVNAMKSGQLVRADILVERILGRQRLPPLDVDQSSLDYRLATFRFVKAIYEDQPVDEAGLDQVYRTLARVPVAAAVEAGLLHHVTLDVYLRQGQWAAAGEAAQRALFYFERAGANGLAFYVQLYLIVIDLAVGDVDAAGEAVARAARLKRQAPELTDNDNLLLVSLRLIQQYEAGAPEGWVSHLMTVEESIPVGELWPAMAEPILTYGRAALGAHATHAAAIAWVRRWRVHQRRSDRFENLISVQEIRALQAARRFQEADEMLERLESAASVSHEIGLLTSGLELHPRSTELATALASLTRRADLPLRQLAEILLLQVRSALAHGDEDGASRQLARLVEAAPPERFASFYRENQAVLAEAVTNRLLRHVLKRMPQLARRLSAVLGDATPEVADDGAGLTRQERRILALLVEGLPNKAIARRLGLATPTVKFHLTRLFAKLDCRNRREAVSEALSRGLIST